MSSSCGGDGRDFDQISEGNAMDIDRAYMNGAFIAGADDYPPRWAAKAQAFRESLGGSAVLDLRYGPGPRNRFDLFLPQAAPKGALVFVHGGYWMAFDRKDWSHLAAGALARGWAVAMPSYTLAPDARVSQMTAEVAAAVGAVADRVEGPIIVTGHSAGGHLSARMACEGALPAALVARMVRAVPLSPLSDLGPISQTKMNETLRLDAAEVAAESPALLPRRAGCEVTVWVGGQERPSFLWQARVLSENWDCPWHVEPGKHHFDVVDDLEDAGSGLVEALVGGL
jgi:arylformamidase